jgi:NTE family protein
MEPTIRKGEQAREAIDLPETQVDADVFEREVSPAEVGFSNPEGQGPPLPAGEAGLDALDPGEQQQEDSPSASAGEAEMVSYEQEDQAGLGNELDYEDEIHPAEQGEQTAENDQIQTPVELPSLINEQETDSVEEDNAQSAEDPIAISPEPENLTYGDSTTPFTTEFLPLPAIEQVPEAANPRKIALVLSGGGARGAFQVGAEKYARQVKGYQWDIIAGVSVGAMNGAMLAMHRYARLLELWDCISDDQVYTGGFNLLSWLKILFGAKSFYSNEPLKKLMAREFEAGRVLDDLHVGAVSLINGEYVQFTRESLELSKAILASASIPVVWPPVEVSADYLAMVDGGVRNITPIGDVLDLEPDEIVIINCGKQQPSILPDAPSNVLTIGLRALDIMQNEIFINDMKEFLRINALVKEAEQQGVVLHHPTSGRPFKYYPCQVIEPDVELGETLDFSQKSIQAGLKAGVRRAREVLGRP